MAVELLPASPCTGCCRLGDDHVCIGCFRHRDEIRQWRLLGPAGQRRILARAAARRCKLFLPLRPDSAMNDISVTLGTPFSATATRVLFCGAGELGKEVVIELKRLGCEVIAVDRYDHAPAMQVADRSHVIDMLDGAALRRVIEAERPHLIVPEIEAIATAELVALESEGYRVVPTARAAQLTMHREGIRRLAAEELGLPVSPYFFADDFAAFAQAVRTLGFPCVVKPVMSSSGKGQSVLGSEADLERAWAYAQAGGRAGAGRVIVEGFIDFDYEITLLTVRHAGGTTFCEAIGHLQVDGDYRESWQPQPMSAAALEESRRIAAAVTGALGGYGIFGVELFVKGDRVWFSEVSPRPHDTGLVTLISQNLSEFALHARAILGLPVPALRQHGPAASCALLVQGDSSAMTYGRLDVALAAPDTDLRLFGKPEVHGSRRLGVALALGEGIEEARQKARAVVATIAVGL
jgi:phosphoribosylglycinamide formyltransferase 2